MARPKAEIDPEEVLKMAKVGCTAEEIAGMMGVQRRTIERRFAAPLKEGGNWLRHTLKRKLFQMALNGNVPALIFAAKVYCGLKEPRDDAFNVNVSNDTTILSRVVLTKIEAEAKPVRDVVSSMFEKYRPQLGNGNGHATQHEET